MNTPPIKIYSLICSRNTLYKPTTLALFEYFNQVGVKVKSLIGKTSIFDAYSEAFNSLSSVCSPEDIIIMCHDDIQILTPIGNFNSLLINSFDENTGFIGVAGTSKLNSNGVWWDWSDPQYMRGTVYHGKSVKEMHPTHFGDPGSVVVLDGLFLAVKVKVLKELIDLKKPETFEGNWDFYDLHYTFQSFLKKKTNKVVPIMLRHESGGDLTNRDSWHKNRISFIEMYKNNIPSNAN